VIAKYPQTTHRPGTGDELSPGELATFELTPGDAS
jgi:hypothetical protein